MLAKLDAIQAQILKRVGYSLPDSLSDRFYSISTKIPITSYHVLPDRAGLILEKLPVKSKQLFRERWSRFYERIPEKKRIRTGEELFHRFVDIRRKIIGAQEKYITIDDGVMCYWETKRRPNKQTVVFLHGFADNKDSVYDFAQEIARDFHVIVPDLPGFGKSFKNHDLTYDLDNLTSWLGQWMDAVGIDQFHLIGNSLGGSAAAHLALHFPDRVKSLTMVSPAAIVSDEDIPSLYHELIDGRNIFQIKTLRDFDGFVQRVFHRSPLFPPFIKDYYFNHFMENYDWYGRLVQSTFKGVQSIDEPAFRKLLLNHRLCELQMPTHIVWGAQDQLFPASFGEFAQSCIERCELTVMPEVGHMAQIEDPKGFATVMRKFFQNSQPSN